MAGLFLCSLTVSLCCRCLCPCREHSGHAEVDPLASRRSRKAFSLSLPPREQQSPAECHIHCLLSISLILNAHPCALWGESQSLLRASPVLRGLTQGRSAGNRYPRIFLGPDWALVFQGGMGVLCLILSTTANCSLEASWDILFKKNPKATDAVEARISDKADP